MNGFNNLPSRNSTNTWVYANAQSNNFKPWQKPAGVSIVHFLVIGGGGGGGSGYCTGSQANTAGGSGGSAGGIVNVTIPSILLPDTLYVRVGLGGAGGAATTVEGANAGQSGDISYVCLYPSANTGSVLIQSSTNNAPGGIAGSKTVGSQGPSLTTVSTANELRWIGINGGFVTQTAAGIASTLAAGNGGSITFNGLLTGGCGGGGTRGLPSGPAGGAGGAIDFTTTLSVAGGISVQVRGGLASFTTAASRIDGDPGIFSYQPFISTGGGGGAGANFDATAVGGNGGAGAIGCGGGGGGGGRALSGAGGKGGDGLIIITCT